jgi:mono/diheme cytochrome c family protein
MTSWLHHNRCSRYAAWTALLLLCAGCHSDMHDQPRYDSLQASDFFHDGQAARQLVEGTVPYRGEYRNESEPLYSGKSEGQFVAELPLEVDRALLERGQERYQIYCSVCHAPTGDGNGMIVQRGFRRPPSFHTERLRNVPPGHIFDVITHGFGAMPSYRVQIEPHDRWAIIAYVRALQLSQHAELDDVPAAERAQLEETRP